MIALLITATLSANVALSQKTSIYIEEQTSAWKSAPQRSCEDTVMASASSLAFQMASLAGSNAAAISNPRIGRVHSYQLQKDAEVLSPAAAEAVLKVGETYLQGGCPTQADAVFRDALQIFTGGFYAAYRQRALVGIDDVRDFKGAVR